MSDSYIFRFATIMVVLVAAILTLVASLLKPMQEDNRRAEKMQEILGAANINVSRDSAIHVYQHRLIAEYAISLQGDITTVYDGSKQEFTKGENRPFEMDMKRLMNDLERYEKGSLETAPTLPLFIMRDHNDDSLFVFPLRGNGLWGPIWGNMALKNDLNTVAGASFDHAGETPGLGAQINTDQFSEQFENTRIFDDDGEFVSIKVVKGGVENSSIPGDHGVDAISGGTITSNGVTHMIEDGFRYYLPFIKKYQ